MCTNSKDNHKNRIRASTILLVLYVSSPYTYKYLLRANGINNRSMGFSPIPNNFHMTSKAIDQCCSNIPSIFAALRRQISKCSMGLHHIDWIQSLPKDLFKKSLPKEDIDQIRFFFRYPPHVHIGTPLRVNATNTMHIKMIFSIPH